MTNEEAYEELKVIYSFCNTEPVMQEAINKVIHHHVKYDWHDLRKNPNDFPTDRLRSVIAWDKNYECCVFAIYTGHQWILRGGGDVYYPSVIAWRYIEPFGDEYLI